MAKGRSFGRCKAFSQTRCQTVWQKVRREEWGGSESEDWIYRGGEWGRVDCRCNFHRGTDCDVETDAEKDKGD